MFNLRQPRDEWQCGQEWINGEKTINPAKGCGQWLYKSDSEKYRSGKGKILNSKDGAGGEANKAHYCPVKMTVIWRKYDKAQRTKFCGSCLETFDGYKNCLCPVCFKLECRKCGNLQQWFNNERQQYKRTSDGRFILVTDESKPIIDNQKCNNCGAIGLDVRQISNAYQRLHGKYEY